MDMVANRVPNGKKLAILIPSLRYGGVQRFMLRLGRAMVEDGYAVDLVLIEAAGELLADVPGGVRVVDLKAGRAAFSLPALVRYLRTEKPDALLAAQTHVNVIALLGRWLARTKTRVIVSERSTLSQSAKNSRRPGDRLAPLLIRLFYPLSEGVIAVSKDAAHDLAARSGLAAGRITPIYNGLDLSSIQQLAGEQCDHPWLASGGPPLILAVGRLEQAKDFATLLRSFARLRQQRAARLLILGEGKQRRALTELCDSLGLSAEDVSLPGSELNPYRFMARAQAFVLSSAWEGFPNVLVEALACGAPVVATDCTSGPREILENGDFGMLVAVGDAAALADAIAATLDGPRDSDRARARAAEFSIQNAARQYERLLFPGICAGEEA